MADEPLIWRVKLAEGKPAKVLAVWLCALAAGLAGLLLFRSFLFGLFGVLAVLGSTLEFWLGVRYRLDDSGASAMSGPSLTKINWADVRRLIVNDAGVTLSPLPENSALTPFRGVFLRSGEMGNEGLLEAIRTFGGDCVRHLG